MPLSDSQYFREPRVTVLARPAFAEPPHLAVHWLGESTDGERLTEFAGRLCYMSQRNPAGRTTRDYLENIKRQGHGSVLEHANYSLLLEGVSRSLTHELVRHRAGFAYCLDGDTLVYPADSAGGAQRAAGPPRTVRELYEMATPSPGRAGLTDLHLRCLDEGSGAFSAGRVKAVVQSGRKRVLRVDLEGGRTITCTRDHRLLTPSGWQRLEDAVGGFTVTSTGAVHFARRDAQLMVDDEPRPGDCGRNRPPFYSRPLGRERDAIADGGEVASLASVGRRATLFGPASAVALLPQRGAAGRGSDTPRRAAAPRGPTPRGVVRITDAGYRETFDVEMEGPHHNFVANGIVTHNSQLSQRYVDESQAAFVVPPAILGDHALERSWREQVEGAQASYVALVEKLMERHAWVADRVHRRKMAREAARAVLPNSTETKIVVTGNARAWRTMLELRASEGAELEIRRLAVAVLHALREEAPGFFSDFEIYVATDRREAARVSFHKV